MAESMGCDMRGSTNPTRFCDRCGVDFCEDCGMATHPEMHEVVVAAQDEAVKWRG